MAIDTNDAEACGELIAAGKADGGLAADLSLLANEALYERDVAKAAELRLIETINAMRAEIARLTARAATAELALCNMTARHSLAADMAADAQQERAVRLAVRS